MDIIGNTPLVELPESVTKCQARIFVKLEENNWGGSSKSRVGYKMIVDAEKSGLINCDQPNNITIIEPTGGNTGVGLAQVCTLRGYRCILVIPDDYMKSKIQILQAMGAQVIFANHKTGNDSHIVLVEKILKDHPDFIWLNQFDNFSNSAAHFEGTGQEIIQQAPDVITHFVSGIGSGGTISGVGRAIKQKYPEAKVIAVQPEGCDVLNGFAIPHKIQGFAIGRIPKVLDKSVIDQVVDVNQDDVLDYQIELVRKCGLLLGYSSIANVLATIRLARKASPSSLFVTVSPDSGKNYISERDIGEPPHFIDM